MVLYIYTHTYIYIYKGEPRHRNFLTDIDRILDPITMYLK
jgi:hypothetical protein